MRSDVALTTQFRRLHPYAAALREAMTGAEVDIKWLAQRTGFSYEHCRKVLSGAPVASTRFNELACKHLNLDAAKSWRLARAEKVSARYRRSPDAKGMGELARDTHLLHLWQELSPAAQEKALGFIESLSSERLLRSTRMKKKQS